MAAPILDASAGDDPLATLTNLAYPVADLMLLAIVIAAFGLTGWRPGRVWLLLGLGLGAMAMSDGTYLYQTAKGTYTGGLVDVGWVVAAVLVALAALSPLQPTAPPRLTGARTIVVPTAAALVGRGHGDLRPLLAAPDRGRAAGLRHAAGGGRAHGAGLPGEPADARRQPPRGLAGRPHRPGQPSPAEHAGWCPRRPCPGARARYGC